ncbi:heavy metal-associated isoprenylated plant protein 3-like [Syzygium oleosum]|uniref:heavy metal-associated isoprenylated plant protein 3-like n=1 Tax=Syzygium oleosum TaxID=219896 RepID=UPI0024B8D22B|nr:heavy metal-associated isoprenylated plant protein 3-like [Syzygium oleosum]
MRMNLYPLAEKFGFRPVLCVWCGCEGVEKAKAEREGGEQKLTVRGEMDPPELREELQGRAKKKVDLVSPQLPKEEEDKGSKSSASSDNDNNKAKDKEPEDQKPKEPPVTTVVLKLKLHCAACIRKIERRII